MSGFNWLGEAEFGEIITFPLSLRIVYTYGGTDKCNNEKLIWILDVNISMNIEIGMLQSFTSLWKTHQIRLMSEKIVKNTW